MCASLEKAAALVSSCKMGALSLPDHLVAAVSSIKGMAPCSYHFEGSQPSLHQTRLISPA